MSIIFTVTSCKRLSLFIRAIKSFEKHCLDFKLIESFICIDDNSSESDRAKMMEEFPYFTFVFKGPDEIGHIDSMNKVIDTAKSLGAKYLVHLEDDFEFNYSCEYIRIMKDILDKNVENIYQVAFNRDYALTPGDDLCGSFYRSYDDITYRIHTYFPEKSFKYEAFMNNCEAPHSVRWPHFTLRPSMINVAALDAIGHFENKGFFEFEWAKKYANAGYKTGFLDTICCTDISSGDNSYILNGVDQFGTFRPHNKGNVTVISTSHFECKHPIVIFSTDENIACSDTVAIRQPVGSNIDMLKSAIVENIFSTELFCWIDPSKLSIPDDVVIEPPSPKIRASIYKGVISDAIISGDLEHLNMIEDLALIYKESPEYFDIYHSCPQDALKNYHIPIEIESVVEEMNSTAEEEVSKVALELHSAYTADIDMSPDVILKMFMNLMHTKPLAAEFNRLIKENREVYNAHLPHKSKIFGHMWMHHIPMQPVPTIEYAWMVKMLAAQKPFMYINFEPMKKIVESKLPKVFIGMPCPSCNFNAWNIASNYVIRNQVTGGLLSTHKKYDIFDTLKKRSVICVANDEDIPAINKLMDDDVIFEKIDKLKVGKGDVVIFNVDPTPDFMVMYENSPSTTFIDMRGYLTYEEKDITCPICLH